MLAKALDSTIQHFGLSARELAIKTGVTDSTISKLRSGSSDAKLSTFEALVNALPDEAINYLFFNALLSRKICSKDIYNYLTVIACVVRDSDKIEVNTSENSYVNVSSSSVKVRELVAK